jgi:hypothetical protein
MNGKVFPAGNYSFTVLMGLNGFPFVTRPSIGVVDDKGAATV